MSKKIVLITGSTDGIGKETARLLLNKDFTVWLHGRNEQKVQKVKNDLIDATGIYDVKVLSADFSSLKQVKKASMILRDQLEHLDVLINNAGIMTSYQEKTIDGFEKTFQVNYLAPFLLTNLLLPLLKDAPQGRIIHVSSMIHSRDISFENLDFSHSFEGSEAYSATKLYNILFSNKLSRMLTGSPITSNSLHPGVINTKLLRQHFGNVGQPVAQGAETPVFLASSHEAAKHSGKYFVNSHLSSPAKLTADREVQDKLWNESLRMVSNYLAE